jgi:hypothetical protein
MHRKFELPDLFLAISLAMIAIEAASRQSRAGFGCLDGRVAQVGVRDDVLEIPIGQQFAIVVVVVALNEERLTLPRIGEKLVN